MALGRGKKTVNGSGRGLLNLGVAAAAIVWQGGMAMLSSGFARPARAGQGGNDLAKIADVATSRVLGVFQASVTGTTDGAQPIDAQGGDWLARNSAGNDAITTANIGHYCFVVDDETVSRTSLSGTRPRAGVIIAVDATGVMVRMKPEIAAAASRSVHLPFFISETDTLAPTNAELVSPVSGTITRIFVVVQKAVTTGGDVTALVGVTTVAGMTVTVPDAAAKGATYTATPTPGDISAAVAAGGRIQIAPGAPFNTAGAVSGFVEIGY